jgi:L-amino acid N-acyltransferase YncA
VGGTGADWRSGMLIRPACGADMRAMTAIYRVEVLSGVATFELDPPDEAEMARRFEAVVAGGYPYLIGEAAGQVAGFAYATAYRARPAYRFTVEDSIYVAASAQRRGVGGALLSALIELSGAAGHRQMIAVIGDSANAASIRLHRAAGFTFAGVLHAVGYKHGRWLDSVLMQRSLGPGDASAPVKRAASTPCRSVLARSGPASGSRFDEPDPLFEHLEHATEIAAALQDQTGRRHDAVGALPPRQLRALLDAVKRACRRRKPPFPARGRWRSHATRPPRPCGRKRQGSR